MNTLTQSPDEIYGDTSVVLSEGERVIWSRRANRSTRLLAVGGRLLRTTDRLLFIPNRVERLLGRQPSSIKLNSVQEIEVDHIHPLSVLNGGWRRRLKIQSSGGRTTLFVVNKLEDVLGDLASVPQSNK